jgi:hypothetical protein
VRFVETAHPFTLPDLAKTYGSASVTTQYTSLIARAPGDRHGSVSLFHAALELPLFRRNVHFGGDYMLLQGLSTEAKTGAETLSGNVRTHLRVTWVTFDGLAFGGIAQVVFPTADFNSKRGERLAAEAISTNPTQINMLRRVDIALTTKADARLTLGNVTFQAREGFEYGSNPNVIRGAQILSTTSFYVGVLVERRVTLGVELEQLYLLDAHIEDDTRSAFVGRAGATWDLSPLGLSGHLFTNLGSPSASTVSSLWGGSVSLEWKWDVRPEKVMEVFVPVGEKVFPRRTPPQR